MDNSISTFLEAVRKLIEAVETYATALYEHAIVLPEDRLDDAFQAGLSEEVYRHYLNYYHKRNRQSVEGILQFIDGRLLDYLREVEAKLQSIVDVPGAAPTGSSTSSVASGSSRRPGPSPAVSSRVSEGLAQAMADNDKDLEKVFGIAKGPRMTVADADRQSANPHYSDRWEDEPFRINCATCTVAYALRLRGFNVTAKGNERGSGSLNERISRIEEYLQVWKNPDGTTPESVRMDDWMAENSISQMTVDDYRNFFEQTCREKGVYVVMVQWRKGSFGHATILQRDEDGVLYYIEPQHYESTRGEDGRMSLDDLLMYPNGESRLLETPAHPYGVLRVDDKLFNTNYANLLDSK